MPWYKRIFVGRYGIKRLSMVLFVLAALFLGWHFIMPVRWNHTMPLISAALLAALGLWRCFSRRIDRRAQEERVFDMVWDRVRLGLSRLAQRLPGRAPRTQKDPRYIVIKCPRCKQQLRLPRGEGLVRITCKRCTEKFERRV